MKLTKEQKGNRNREVYMWASALSLLALVASIGLDTTVFTRSFLIGFWLLLTFLFELVSRKPIGS